ncbi:MAG: hypothetical protein HY814_07525 [Candidatus Riflebacteria bacterium]|nr:hypothetical protein [Candidatus Riflebacteria bacterium]
MRTCLLLFLLLTLLMPALPLLAEESAGPSTQTTPAIGHKPGPGPKWGQPGQPEGPPWMQNLTLEEKAKLQAMTPDERKVFMKEKRQAWLETLPPEQRQKMQGPPWMQNLTDEERAKLEAMTPEQRMAFIEEKRQVWLKTLPPEQQQKAQERWERRQQKMQQGAGQGPGMRPGGMGAGQGQGQGRGFGPRGGKRGR